MTEARTPPLPVQCAVLSLHDIADMFGKGETWFREHQAQLEAEGFPLEDELLDGWNKYHVEDWFRARIYTATNDNIAERLEEMRHGKL